jgi:hypothetical protein
MLNRTILGFVGGAVAYLGFVMAVWGVIQAAGYIPADALPPWWTGGIPPFGIPRVVSNAFWGGLWGAVLSNVLVRVRGSAYWIAWPAVGSVALSLVSLFLVPSLKGNPINPLTVRGLAVQFALAGTWGLGAAIVLRILGVARAPRHSGAVTT